MSVRYLFLVFLLAIGACTKSEVPASIKSDASKKTHSSIDSIRNARIQDSLKREQWLIQDSIRTDSVERFAKLIWGYRFHITGDFTGSGHPQTLTEHFYSRRDKRETNKFYDRLD